MQKNNSKFNLTKYRKKYITLNINRYDSIIKSNFEQYKKCIKSNMSFYNLTKSDNFKNMNQTKLFFHNSGIELQPKENDFIEHINFLNYSTRNKKKNNIIDYLDKKNNMNIFTSRENTLYKNPFHSFSVLKINNQIHSNILKLNLKRQRYIFNESINYFQNTEKENLNRLSKMRISQLTPVNDNNMFNLNGSNIPKLNFKINSFRSIFKSQYNKNLFSHLYTKLKASIGDSSKNYPQSREQFSLISNDENIFLIGGIGCVNECDEIWNYNIRESSWDKIKSKNKTKARFGHTATLNKISSKIYVFGGVSKLDIWKNSITRGGEENYGNFELFDLVKKEWINPIITKLHPPFRRNHTAELVGNDLIIMLGINKENEVLNDAHVLNISFPHHQNERWNEVKILKDNIAPKLYGHSSALVLDENIINYKNLGIYNFPEEQKKNTKKNGIYIFGGKNKYMGGTISNDIYVFHMGREFCWWENLENIKGAKPCPRYFHSMSFYRQKNFLIIHGGKTDSKNGDYSLNDTFLFDLKAFQWNKIILTGIDESLIKPRYGHQSVICRNQLYIFGGMYNGNYVGSNMLIVNLAPNILNIFLLNDKKKNNNAKGNKINNNKKGNKAIEFPKLK